MHRTTNIGDVCWVRAGELSNVIVIEAKGSIWILAFARMTVKGEGMAVPYVSGEYIINLPIKPPPAHIIGYHSRS